LGNIPLDAGIVGPSCYIFKHSRNIKGKWAGDFWIVPLLWNGWSEPRQLVSSYQLNAHFLYSIALYMLHYNPQHVSSSTLLIFRIGQIVLLQPLVSSLFVQYSMPVAVRSQPAYCTVHRVAIPEAVIIQFVLLKMSKVLLETCWGL